MTYRSSRLALVGMAIVGQMGCIDLESDPDGGPMSGPTEALRDGGAAPLDAQVATGGGTTGGGTTGGGTTGGGTTGGGTTGGGAADGGIVQAGSPLRCQGPLTPAAQSVCSQPDPHETSSAMAAPIETPRCAELEAFLAGRDADRYKFTTTKSDPVAIGLSYKTQGTADLAVRAFGPTGSLLAYHTGARQGPGEDVSVYFASTAGASYDVEVEGNGLGTCDPYTLRIDPYTCTDSFEDNDSTQTATQLEWNPQGVAELDATLATLDEDHYRFTTVKADPVRVTVTYTPPKDATLDIASRVFSDSGSLVTYDTRGRTGPSETHDHWIPAGAPSTTSELALEASGSGCGTYHVKVDSVACTDPYEDNDTGTNATKLTPGQMLNSTILRTDADHYDVSALAAAGTCTVTYALGAGAPQSLTARVYSRTGSLVTYDTSPEGGAQKTLTATWSGGDAVVLAIEADSWTCQPYTVVCTAR